MEKIKKLINKIDTPIWLEWFFVILIIVRIPTLFEPYYYGDEMIYMALGEGMRQGLGLYSQVHDNKPPLLYLLAAISGGSLFIFRAILAFWNLISVYFFWKIVSGFYPKAKRFSQISTIIFGVLTTIPLFEGNIANAELFMLAPTLFAFYIILNKQLTLKNIFISGFLLGIASLFKMPAIFESLTIPLFWLTQVKKTEIKILFVRLVTLGLAIITPVVMSFLYYAVNGNFQNYLIAAYLQNFGYLSSWQRSSVSGSFLEKNGPLVIRSIMYLALFIKVWILKNKLSKVFIFSSLWLFSSIFAITLSERPYPHYLIQAVGPLSIFITMLLISKRMDQVYSILPIGLFVFTIFWFKFWYYPNLSYYLRFINYTTGKISRAEYLNSFSPYLEKNYQIAQFLKTSTNKDDRVFVWGNDSAAIYTLAKRLPPVKYVADYHILDFMPTSELITNLESSKPKFVVILENSRPMEELKTFVMKNYYIISEIGSSQIWLKTR